MRWPTLIIASSVAGAIAADTVVRIEPSAGGPRLTVNGAPQPLRCFYGSPGTGTFTLSEEWATYRYQVVPDHAINGTGTLHFRFEHRAADYALRGLRVVDVASGQSVWPEATLEHAEAFAQAWYVFPPDQRNTVGTVTPGGGALGIRIAAPPTGDWPDFHLHSAQRLTLRAGAVYEVRFEARCSQPCQLRPAVYTVEDGVWQAVGAPEGPFARQLALARDAGVRFVTFPVPTCWNVPEKPANWEPADAAMRSVLAVHPDALIIPRVGMNAPAWWLERHPEARMRFEDGKELSMATVSDRAYRQDAAVHLEALSRHLVEAFPTNLAGIHPCGQNTGEWFYEESWERRVSGYEPPTLSAWRTWRAGQGRADSATAAIPTAERRHAAPGGSALLDPVGQADLIDFNRFWQAEMGDFVIDLAAAARRGTGGTKLVVFFYGYLFEFPPLHNGAPYSGHYALAKVLASPDLDVLCSPISYTDRGWLGTGASMTAAESVALAGKLWLNEDDTRTYLARTTDFGGVADLEQTLDVLRRNTAQAALRGFGTWWMDLPGEGWFADPLIWAEHRRLTPLDVALLQRAQPYTPEIALIVDEDSTCHLSGGSTPVARPLLYDARAAVGRCGAPYGQYLLSDAAAGRVPARLQVHLTSWAVPPVWRESLRATRQPGVTRVWAYAPGCLGPAGLTPAAAAALHGFVLRRAAGDSALATPTAAGQALGLSTPWGQSAGVQPLFTVELQPDDTVLATYQDGSPALVVRRDRAGTEVFAGTPAWSSEVFRALSRLAGVHLFCETDAAVWAAEGTLCVQAHGAGPLRLHTGSTAGVHDLLTGEALGAGPLVVVPFRRGETRILDLGILAGQ